MLRLVTRRMLDRKGDPEQLSDKRPGRILSTLALQPEVVAKYAPCGFRMICIMIHKEIVTAGFARKYD